MNRVTILPFMLSMSFWTVVPAVSYAELPGLPAEGRDSSGIISGLNGHALAIPGSGASRSLKIGDRVAAGHEIRVDSGGTAELLWDRRALFALEERSRIALQESRDGSVSVQVLDGVIRIAYSYNEGHPTDTLKVQMPGTKATLRGGIIEVAVGASQHTGRPQQTKLSETAGIASEILRVVEGQVQIEPRSPNVKPFILKAGYEWHALPDGKGSEAIRPTAGRTVRELVTVQEHHHVPAIQRMVQVHVDHALELERALSKPSGDENESEGVAGTKGAIVATSLGIPLISTSGSGTAITATSAIPSAPVTSSVGPTTVAPPAVIPIIQTPIISTPNVTTVTPSQSGGFNSQSLLRDVLQDVSKSKGQAKGHGKD